MKTILVPTDFSAEANNALSVAVTIARQTKAAIKLFHVIPSMYEPSFATAADLPKEGAVQLDQRRASAEHRMHELSIKWSGGGVAIKPQVEVTIPFVDIWDRIVSSKADLIVIGTRGDSGWHELFIGSRTEKVVRHAGCPVLSVRGSVANLELRNVVFATDCDAEAKYLLEVLQEWQRLFGFQLHLLYVNTTLTYSTTFKIEQRLAEFLEKHDGTYTTAIVDAYSEREGIEQYAAKVGADMLVLATHGRHGIAHFLDGSITEEVVNHAHIPVLTYHIHPGH